jgi:photosystem II stability/assembly factor-like uncharacterized protein
MNRLALVPVLAAGIALAQDTPAPAQTAAHAKDLQPRPAEIAPRAASSLLLAIAQASGRLVAVGDRGVILLSDDGAKWEQVASPVHATLTAVSFADAQHGWAVGHDAAILHTADGGKTWALQHFAPAESKPLLSVLALDAQRAYATGAYGLFLGTTDGGASWAPVDAPALVEEGLHLNALIRLNNGALFLAGETGMVAVSADGVQWHRLKIPYEGSLFGALARGEKGALVFGLRGNVYASDDVHSNQWTKVDTKTVQSMFGGALLPSGEAALVGADGEILLVDPAGAVRKARDAKDEHSFGSGTLSGVIPRGDLLLVVGELGASRITLAK